MKSAVKPTPVVKAEVKVDPKKEWVEIKEPVAEKPAPAAVVVEDDEEAQLLAQLAAARAKKLAATIVIKPKPAPVADVDVKDMSDDEFFKLYPKAQKA